MGRGRQGRVPWVLPHPLVKDKGLEASERKNCGVAEPRDQWAIQIDVSWICLLSEPPSTLSVGAEGANRLA